MILEKLTGTLANEIFDEMRDRAFEAEGTYGNIICLAEVKNVLQDFMDRGDTKKRKAVKKENIEYQLTDQVSGSYVHLTLSSSAADLLEWLYDNDYLQDDICIVNTDMCTEKNFID